jgi:beta-phosphoglucomutase
VILAKPNSDRQLPYPSAIILDFDGVVVDSLKAHLDAWNSACLQIFRQPIMNIQSIAGLSSQAIAGKLAHFFGHPSLSTPLRSLKESILESFIEQIPLIEGIKPFLSQVMTLQIPYAIGSNSRKKFIQMLLKYHRLDFPALVTSELVKKAKPHPDIFLHCAAMLGVPHSQHATILVFEDSTHGVQAALKAKMTPVGMTTMHCKDTLHSAGAKYTINNFNGITFVRD